MANPKKTSLFWSAATTPGLRTDTYFVQSSIVVAGILKQLQLNRPAKLVIGVDTETIRFDPLIKPNRIRLVQISTGTLTAVFDTWKLGPKALRAIVKFLEDPTIVKVFHNAKFDLKFLMYCLGLEYCWPIFDTQLAAQLMDLGDPYGKHDLEYCVQHYLGIDIDKDIGHQWSGDLSKQQIIYASNDASVLPALRDELLKLGRERGLIAAYILEFGAIQPTAIMELNGFLLDQDKWNSITAENNVKARNLAEQIIAMLPAQAGDNMSLFEGVMPFNLDSNELLKERLTSIGIDLPTFIDDKTGEEKETMLSDKMAQIAGQHKIIPLVISYAKARKAVTSYGKKFLRHINPYDGRAHANFRQIGTITTRYAVTKPPLHGIPKQSDHRECFVAMPGHKLVWGDYSQIELRILAELCQDPAFMQAFIEGKDQHTFTASTVFGIGYEAVGDIQRRRAKDLNFGEVYGVGIKRFAERAGITEQEARRLMDLMGKKYPKKKIYLTNAAGHARVNGYCQTMSGKIIDFGLERVKKLKGEDYDKAISAIERHGKNYVIQGSSADITKRTLKVLYDELRTRGLLQEIRLVHCVHDEIVLEVIDRLVDFAGALLQRCMISAGEEFLHDVPVVVDTETNDFWKKRKDD